MTLKCRKDLPFYTDIDTKQNIQEFASCLHAHGACPVQPNKAIVGRNAFAHSSGIHQDGVLKNRGELRNHRSRRRRRERFRNCPYGHAAAGLLSTTHYQRLGINLTNEELNAAYEKFLLLADRKKDVNDSDLLIIVGVNRSEAARKVRLKFLQVVCGKSSVPMATVKLNIDGENLRGDPHPATGL